MLYSIIALEKIYEVKKRPEEKPLSIMVSSTREISKYAVINNDIERNIIENFMPGPLTIILNKKEGVFDYISSGKNTIGIRIPDNDMIMEILKESELPIVAPSANISGEPSGVVFEDILKDFNGKVDICINGGKPKISEPSTIVQVIDGEPVIIREGKITLDEIKRGGRKWRNPGQRRQEEKEQSEIACRRGRKRNRRDSGRDREYST